MNDLSFDNLNKIVKLQLLATVIILSFFGGMLTGKWIYYPKGLNEKIESIEGVITPEINDSIIDVKNVKLGKLYWL